MGSYGSTRSGCPNLLHLLPMLLLLLAPVSADGVENLRLLDITDPAEHPPAISVLSNSPSELILEFRLPAIRRETISIDQRDWSLLTIDGGGFTTETGSPLLPTFTRMIEVPAGKSVSWEVVDRSVTVLPDQRPLPVQSDTGTGFDYNSEAYRHTGDPLSGFDNSRAVVTGLPALAGDKRIVPITVMPVQFDPAINGVQIADRIELRLTFTDASDLNNPTRELEKITPSFDALYRNLVVNYQGPRENQTIARGSYVVICPDDPAVIAALEPLLTWRSRQGFEVRLATLTETGSSNGSILAWLQQAYQSWDNPPEYVVLIGDVSGSIAIPTWIENYTSYHGEGDKPYVKLSGNDQLSDAHIGRISVDSIGQLQLYVNKIVSYESTPYMAETDWYSRGCVVGDPGTSGPTCVQIMQWLSERLSDYGYADIDSIYSSPFVSGMTNSLNDGASIFAYRGYYNMSGFDISDIGNLQNYWKMPFAINITCDTGSFAHGTSRSEAWIRAGLPPDIPTAGIASIGSSTIGTHTRYNNCITYGVLRAPFWEEIYQFGAALTRGEYELYLNYSVNDPTNMAVFMHWNNLMGDPAGELWTGIPAPLTVTHPSDLPLGATSVPVTVSSSGYARQNAYVCLWRDGDFQIGGYTNAAGEIDIPVSITATGDIKLTVTLHDHIPYLTDVSVAQDDYFASYAGHLVDDDNSGASEGNSDGELNPTETIELSVQITNHGSESLSDVTGTLSCASEEIILFGDSASFGAVMAPGATAWSQTDFTFSIEHYAEHGKEILLSLDLSNGSDTWHSVIPVTIVAADLEAGPITDYGFGDEMEPGESGEISLSMRNYGGLDAVAIGAILSTSSPFLEVTDPIGTFTDIPVNMSGTNAADRFGIDVSENCFIGHQAPLTLELTYNSGATAVIECSLTIGTRTLTDPTGPDAYGYYAYDNLDVAYADAPVYEWVEIATNYGGSGSPVGLNDYGQGQDDSRSLDLPFVFTYYGEQFDRATICSNGWMAMGDTHLTNYRNWTIPSAGSPENLIAPMWDNFYQTSNNLVYHWFDEAHHRYIVQWSRVVNMHDNSQSTFQVILYDPTYYTTGTGDGIIVFQYEAFRNHDSLQHYSTTGIQNIDRTDGLLYGYYNDYNDGARPIAAGTAIRFSTFDPSDRGVLSGMITNVTDGDQPLPGAVVTVLESGETFFTREDGTYRGSLHTGTWSLAASHPSFESDTLLMVDVLVGEETVRNFSLIDVIGPGLTNTTMHAATIDTDGPYEISTSVLEYSSLTEISLTYNIAGGGWETIAMEPVGDDVYSAGIPGAIFNSLIYYYITAADNGGNVTHSPGNAPESVYQFWVLPPAFADDAENGEGSWQHYIVTDTFADQWHITDEDNSTPGGTNCWKFGGDPGEEYAVYADGALETEIFTINEPTTLFFSHTINSEESGMYPGYAYDGGTVEISIDGGEWTQATPAGGYNRLVKVRSMGPGPFPAEMPIFAGSIPWREEIIPLNYTGVNVQVRFRFGSDLALNGLGWYIDDVIIISNAPGMTNAEENESAPTRLHLYQSTPNPFHQATNGGAMVRFDLPAAAPARLRIVDTTGRLIHQLVNEVLPAGEHRVVWDGTNRDGRPVASGVYFYVLETDRGRRTRRLMMVR
jgi:Peptidase family C25/FlgD Ig-like domain/Carboxypeptidase regulatory-like domain/Propeptide_C25